MEPKKSRKGLWAIAIALLVLAVLVLCGGIVSIIAGSASDDTAVQTPGAAVGSAGAEAAKGVPAMPSRQATNVPTRTPKPVAEIKGDDIVHVGEDVPAGTYRAIDPIGDGPFELCYWLKSRDAEGADIIDNALPTGGRPQVTLKSGQWFKSQGCPVWRKQ